MKVAVPAPLVRGLKLGDMLVAFAARSSVAVPAPLVRGLKRDMLVALTGELLEVAVPAPLVRGLKPLQHSTSALERLGLTAEGGSQYPPRSSGD